MPKKIHGQGGKTGHNTHEMKGRVSRSEKQKARLERAEERRLRKRDRKIDSVKEEYSTRIKPTADRALSNLGNSKKKLARPSKLIMLLAIDEWHVAETVNALNKKKITSETFTKEDFEDIHFLDKKQRVEAWQMLTGTGEKKISNRSEKELRDDIEKWKRRVPGMAKGLYL